MELWQIKDEIDKALICIGDALDGNRNSKDKMLSDFAKDNLEDAYDKLKFVKKISK